ncbi:MAG: transglutaminase domain-containing protein [Planctomycetes bacterium]|nr:transglutaminase domain-containing protein [Planctomycetota bacterium]MBI3846159.1 transglutaminase domain-containing protein [Planctomycetota bacterium]
MMRTRTGLGLSLVLLLACRNTAPAQPATHEQWSVTRLAGNDVGFVHEAFDPTRRVTTTESTIVFNRLGNKLVIAGTSAFEEGEDGRLREVHTTLSMSADPTSTFATFGPGSMHVRSTSGGRSYERDVPCTATVVGPDWVRRASLERLRSVGDHIEFSTFLAETGGVVAETRTLLEPASADGTRRVREEITGVITQTITLDRDGRVARLEQKGPFGEMVVERADRERAMAAASGAELPGEAFGRTVVHSNVRLPQSREIESVTIRLTHHSPDLGWPDLTSHDQRVIEQTRDHVVLEIRRSAGPSSPVPRPVAITNENRDLLEPNATLGSDDPEVKRIATDVVGDERDAWTAALRLRDWVSEHMTFDLGVALAPASEVVRNRKGTCAAYASILAALCRAAGIPARYVMGFVYCAGSWGGHAWVEISLGDRWVPIDAALPSAGAADAARFRFGASTLADGIGTLTAAGGKLYGNVDVDVVRYAVAGRTVEVELNAPLTRVDGNRYVNVGLGLALSKPDDFAFEGLDAAWPDTTLVRIVGPNGRSARVEDSRLPLHRDVEPASFTVLEKIVPGGKRAAVTVVGRRAFRVTSLHKAAVAVPDGSDLWLLIVEGSDAPALLDIVAGSLSLAEERQLETPVVPKKT